MFPKPITASDIDTAARTIWGESRGEPWLGQLGVAFVIRWRAEKGGWWGSTIKAVCLKDWQFSAWNKNDPNRAKMLELDTAGNAYRQALKAIALALIEDDADPTGGATHYHHKSLSPDWADGVQPSANQGNHLFYEGIA
jgi:N-acetylmuramoyl-L-alanine amidase